MARFGQVYKQFVKDESGQDLIEYALVAGLIGLAAVTAMGTLGNSVSSFFTNINSTLTSAA
ncbi:MAG TPA: Flp family type IVb pilin [Acidobacteriaceae bacterium]|nr:Flp family type IVb pilin [Acidobacteriaceae bacterium]